MGCGKESKREICPVCEIDMFEHEVKVALDNLIEGYRKLLNLESEVENERGQNQENRIA